MPVDVLVIGGGVSGLCAAVECASRGRSVILAEQSQHLGGRAYSFLHMETGDIVDNGQHLMLGCYHSTLRFLRTVGTIDQLSIQPSLDISFRSTVGRYRLRAPLLPSPLHVFGALLRLGSLSWRDRLSMLRIVPALLTANPRTDADLLTMTVDQWLTKHGQSLEAKNNVWNILSIGTMNERPERASAALFVNVLQTVFLGSRRDASIALPRTGLSRLFADGAASYLQEHGGSVAFRARAGNIVVTNGTVESVMLGQTRIEPRAVVSAVPYHAIGAMFAHGSRSALPLPERMDRFEAVPIVSIHLWYDRHFMEDEFTALLGSPIDWVFNKSTTAGRTSGRLMHLSLVISAAREESTQAKEAIVAMADRELRRCFPGASEAALRHSLVIKEKRATFSPSGDIAACRVQHATALRNFFIAGDWTDTGLPATIEGAAQSGYACAELADGYLGTASQGQE